MKVRNRQEVIADSKALVEEIERLLREKAFTDYYRDYLDRTVCTLRKALYDFTAILGDYGSKHDYREHSLRVALKVVEGWLKAAEFDAAGHVCEACGRVLVEAYTKAWNPPHPAPCGAKTCMACRDDHEHEHGCTAEDHWAGFEDYLIEKVEGPGKLLSTHGAFDLYGRG
jgi:hypothetical protein